MKVRSCAFAENRYQPQKGKQNSMSVGLDRLLAELRANDLRVPKISTSYVNLDGRSRKSCLLLVNLSLPIGLINKTRKFAQTLDSFYNFLTNTCDINIPCKSEEEGSYIFSLVTILRHEKTSALRVFRGSFSPQHQYYSQFTKFETFPIKEKLVRSIETFANDEKLIDKARGLFADRDSAYILVDVASVIVCCQFLVSEAQKDFILKGKRHLHMSLAHIL